MCKRLSVIPPTRALSFRDASERDGVAFAKANAAGAHLRGVSTRRKIPFNLRVPYRLDSKLGV